jgi:hypothetical protein
LPGTFVEVVKHNMRKTENVPAHPEGSASIRLARNQFPMVDLPNKRKPVSPYAFVESVKYNIDKTKAGKNIPIYLEGGARSLLAFLAITIEFGQPVYIAIG